LLDYWVISASWVVDGWVGVETKVFGWKS